MSSRFNVRGQFVLCVVAVACIGCAKEPAPSPPAVVEEEVVEEVEVPALATDGPTDDVTAAMAELSETDRAAALAQKICPVSGETLGGMGAPIKVTVKGRDVFLCCPNCREKLEANPDEYLAKLDAK
jgi:YHS domain-containing protein